MEERVYDETRFGMLVRVSMSAVYDKAHDRIKYRVLTRIGNIVLYDVTYGYIGIAEGYFHKEVGRVVTGWYDRKVQKQ